MYLISGTFQESPQRTHFWNNTKLSRKEVAFLEVALMVSREREKGALHRWRYKIPLFHMPIFGGWRRYVVVAPVIHVNHAWYVGWVANDVSGISRINLVGPVRLLVGPKHVQFFGLRFDDGTQIQVHVIGEGRIGDGGQYAQLPLL